MHIKIFLKKLLTISVAVIMAVTLTSCFDLGDFEDEEDYYASFGDVTLVYQNPDNIKKDVKTNDYDVQDYFYNKNTGNDFTYGDPKDEEPDEGKDIPQLVYNYMVIPINREMEVDSLGLYFNATTTSTLEIIFYVVDSLPNGGDFTKIQLLGEYSYQQKVDDDGNPMFDENGDPIFQEKLDDDDNPIYDENGKPVYVPMEYSDPADEFIVGKANVQVIEGQWVSLLVDLWNNKDILKIEESQYLLLRFANNCGISAGKNPPVAFRTTNLLVRSFLEK